MSTYLVNNETAVQFISLAQTETGAKSMLGDAEQFESVSGVTIVNANIALRESTAKVAALAKDETRTEVAKHEAAMQLANRTISALEKAKGSIEARANFLAAEGQGEAEAYFAPLANRAALDSEVRGWIKEEMKSPEGIAKVRKAAMSDVKIASVIHHSPDFLLGIESGLHMKMRFEITEKHLPNAYQKMTQSVELVGLLNRYDKTISKVRTSFYMPGIAAKASSRVEI